MIEAAALTKRYGTHTAVDHLSFQAHKGEIVGLLGPNGAGKTTTMRILTGFMPPSSGSALVAGYDVLKESMEVRRRVGYLPERVPVYPDMTVYQFVMFWAKLRSVKNPKRRVEFVLEQFSLTNRRNMLVRSLSKGLRQRLGLAQALVHEPEVIILDEPTIGIDPKQVIEVRETVRQLRENHTVLFSSHILSEVEQVCDRVMIINKGRLIAEGTAAELARRSRPKMQLYVTIEAKSGQNPLKALEKIPGVVRAYRKDAGYILEGAPETDIRAEAARSIAEQGLTLLEMRPMENRLEDIFLDLVDKG